MHSLENPRLLILSLCFIIVGGVVGFMTRTGLEDPQSQVRGGYVTTYLPGAEPQEVESLISEPIEKVLREAGTVRAIESSSLRGVSLVFIVLIDEIDDAAESWSKLQDKLTEVVGKLPPAASVPVLVDERAWGSHTRVIAIHESGEHHVPQSVLARWAKELDSQLSFVDGTRFTETFGIPDEEVLVEVRAEALAATKMTVGEIAQRIRQRDSGGMDSMAQAPLQQMPISLSGDVDSLSQLRNLVLRGDDRDRQLKLGDVAVVQRGERFPRHDSAVVDGRRAAVIATRMDDAYDIDAWTERQQQVLDRFEAALPAGLKLKSIFSQKRYTDERAGNLYESLALGMVLVVIVVCFMMGWRAAVPICAGIPLSLGLVFLLMIPFGISLHQMSIAGLILALGMLIDNPIIIVDDIQRRLDQGKTASEALRFSVRRLTVPLLGSNVTTILGFTPILLVGGPTGEFMEELGWSVIACLVSSLILSLTVIPALATWFLRPAANDSAEIDVNHFKPRRQNRIQRGYLQCLVFGMRYPLAVIAISIILPMIGFVVGPGLQEQFFPMAERDHFHFSLRLPAQATLDETERVALRAREIVMRHPEIEDVAIFTGKSAPRLHYSMIALEDSRSNYAQGLAQLKSGPVSLDLIHQIQANMDKELTGAQCIVTVIEQGPPALAPIELRVYGPSLEVLDEIGERARRLLMRVPGIIHSRTSLDAGGPGLLLDVKQSEAEKSGMVDESISRQLRDCIDGQVATNMSEEVEEIPIRVRLARQDVSAPEKIVSLPIMAGQSQRDILSLGSVAQWSVGQEVFSIPRRNSTRCNTVFGYVRAGMLPIPIEDEFKRLMREENFQFPPGYSYDFGGVSLSRDSAVGKIALYSMVVAVLIVGVLVLTLGSFRLAGVIASVAILSVGLALLSLWLFGYPIGIVAIIGIAGLMGLAVNDSIVVLSECQLGESEGEPLERCIYDASRHVLATSVTTVAGVLPLILRGGVFWPPMMIVLAGGIIGATFIALGFTPACYKIYLWFNRRGEQQPSLS